MISGECVLRKATLKFYVRETFLTYFLSLNFKIFALNVNKLFNEGFFCKNLLDEVFLNFKEVFLDFHEVFHLILNQE